MTVMGKGFGGEMMKMFLIESLIMIMNILRYSTVYLKVDFMG